MKLRSAVLGSFLIGVLAAGCNAKVATVLESEAGGLGAGLPDEDRPLVPASKVDLLLVVDDSQAMADKSSRLASSIGTLVRNVATVGDVHVGVISSSLGSFGGDICDVTFQPTVNGRAYLRKTGPDGAIVPGAETGVLSYTGGSVDDLVSRTEALVRGTGERGCGLEAQLESMYRFLVQPDPWMSVTVDGTNRATFGTGIDAEVLAQRKAFLRPDSALVVVMLTDEDDSSADPLSVGGQGWAFMSRRFPGSKVFRHTPNEGTTAARPTSACLTNPGSPDCTSCGFAALCDASTPECQKLRSDPNCTASGSPVESGAGYDGYYKADEDALGVRFHRMKERFGVDPQYPLRRYVDGLTLSVVPNRGNEHPTRPAPGQDVIEEYDGTPNCTNPIFAAELPSAPGDEICSLARGPRSRELVLFAVLGGVPKELATATPNWEAIVGRDPDAYDASGIDPHMVPSTTPRAGLPDPSSPATDPVHGREFFTNGRDLQYACTFALPEPKTCDGTVATYCECGPESESSSPICGAPSQQLRAKAYPTLRPLRVVRALGERGVVGSVCSDSYDATMELIGERLAPRLAR